MACLRVSAAIIKCHDCEQLGEERIYFSSTSQSFTEKCQDSKAGQKPQDRSCCRGHGGELLTILLPMACSACTPQDHFPRGGTIHNGLGLPTSITNSENALETCLQTNLKKVVFQLRVSLFPDYLCQTDTKLARTRYRPSF